MCFCVFWLVVFLFIPLAAPSEAVQQHQFCSISSAQLQVLFSPGEAARHQRIGKVARACSSLPPWQVGGHICISAALACWDSGEGEPGNLPLHPHPSIYPPTGLHLPPCCCCSLVKGQQHHSPTCSEQVPLLTQDTKSSSL